MIWFCYLFYRLIAYIRRMVTLSFLTFSLLFGIVTSHSGHQNPLELSQIFLQKAQLSESVDSELQVLAQLHPDSLTIFLNSDKKRIAFWVNLYNGFTILRVQSDTELYNCKRQYFFSKKWLHIAGQMLSFDCIEHGILRRSKHKYSRGYFNKFFFRQTRFEKLMRVDSLDYRIHFALNCGANSCPPVYVYDEDKLDMQLNLAMERFLRLESTYVENSNTLFVSKIFYWFTKDFGGKRGIIEIHKDLGIVPKNVMPLVNYSDYDWKPIY